MSEASKAERPARPETFKADGTWCYSEYEADEFMDAQDALIERQRVRIEELKGLLQESVGANILREAEWRDNDHLGAADHYRDIVERITAALKGEG